MKRFLAVAVAVGIVWCAGMGTALADGGQMSTEELIAAVSKYMNMDFDDDGVKNVNDTCADTPAGTEVDEKGCSVEQDSADAESGGSGGDDEIDLSTLSRMMAEIARKDFDSDGVINLKDQCADTPAGTDVDELGCPVEEVAADPLVPVTPKTDDAINPEYGHSLESDGGSCSLSAAAGSASPMGLLMLLPLLPLAWSRRR